MATTTPTGLHIPTSGDAPNVPADLATLAADLDLVTIPQFASTSARDAAFAQRYFGVCFVGSGVSNSTLYKRRGSGWYPLMDATEYAGAMAALSWTNLTVKSGFSANGTPRVTRINGMVYMQDGFSSSGMAANGTGYVVTTLPAGFRPTGQKYCPAGSSNGDNPGMFVINPNGDIEVRCGATLSGYYRLDSVAPYPATS